MAQQNLCQTTGLNNIYCGRTLGKIIPPDAMCYYQILGSQLPKASSWYVLEVIGEHMDERQVFQKLNLRLPTMPPLRPETFW